MGPSSWSQSRGVHAKKVATVGKLGPIEAQAEVEMLLTLLDAPVDLCWVHLPKVEVDVKS